MIFALFHNLVVLAVVSTGLSLSGWACAKLARRRSASFRNQIWRLVFLGTATALVCTVFQWRIDLPVLPPVPVVLPAQSAPAPAASLPKTQEGGKVISTVSGAVPAHSATIPAVRSRHPSLPLMAVLFWGAGVAWMLLSLAVGWIRLAILLGKHVDTPPAAWSGLDGHDPVRLRVSDRVKAPLLVGLWKPVVIFPREAVEWPLERIRMTLAHEREHVRRADVPFLLFARVILAACWFNPLPWMAFRRLQAEAEAAADDAVVTTLRQAPEYASNLLEIVREMRGGSAGLFPAVGIAEASPMEARVRKILDPDLDRSRLTRRIAWTMGVGCVLGAVAALTLHFTAPLAKARLVGQITDSDGKPLAGVHVSIEDAWVRDGTSPLCPSSYADCGRETTTDAAGSFVFEKLDPTLFFSVVMAKPGYVTLKRNYEPAKGPKHVKLTARTEADLVGKGVVRGRVVDADGKPVAGAIVVPVAFHRGLTTFYNSNSGDSLALTDDDGEFLLTTLPDIGEVNVKVSAAGFAPRISDALKVGAESVAVPMDRGATATGRLVRHGRPVAGVRVGLCQMSRNSNTFLGDLIAVTDAEGRFTFLNVPASEVYYVYARREGRGDVTEPKMLSVREPGTTADAGDLAMVPGVVTEVEVRLRDGAPIPPNTRALADFDTLWDSQLSVLDEKGRYRVLAFPGEKVGVTVTVPGYKVSPANAGYDKLNGFSASFIAGKVQGRYVLTLDRESDLLPPDGEANLGGIVLGANGVTVAGASVTIFGDDDYVAITNGEVHVVRFPRRQAKTDEQGRFVIVGPVHNAMIYVQASAGAAFVPVEDFHGEIRLQPWGRIEGTVLAEGKPQPGRQVEVYYFPMGTEPGQVRGYIKHEVKADTTGHYVVPSVLPGLVQISSLDEKEAERGRYREFLHAEVKPGEATEFDLRPPGAAIQGKLLLPPGWKQGEQYDAIRMTFHVTASMGLSIPQNATPQERAKIEREHFDSPEGRKAYLAATMFETEVSPDGGFVLRDVPAGVYDSSVAAIKFRPGRGPEWLPISYDSTQTTVTPEDVKARRVVRVSSEPLKAQPQPPQVGQMLPDFSVQISDGTTVTRDSFRGRFLLIRVSTFKDNEITDRETEMEKLLRDLGRPANFAVLDVDYFHGDSTLRTKLAAAYSRLWLIARESAGEDGLAQRLSINSAPYYLLIDPNGKVVLSRADDLYHVTRDIANALGK